MSKEIIAQSKQFIKSHKKEIIQLFANDPICPPQKNPISIFMAGAAGSGKTEFSMILLKTSTFQAAKIDADEIRNYLPEYKGKNSSLFNLPASIGIEYIQTYCLKKNKNFVMDSTFSFSLTKAELNIQRSLKRKRKVIINYVYQNPLLSWYFVQKRESKTNRFVPKEAFIKTFLNSYQNVNIIKRKFDKNIILNLITRNVHTNKFIIQRDIRKLDKVITLNYTSTDLNRLI